MSYSKNSSYKFTIYSTAQTFSVPPSLLFDKLPSQPFQHKTIKISSQAPSNGKITIHFICFFINFDLLPPAIGNFVEKLTASLPHIYVTEEK